MPWGEISTVLPLPAVARALGLTGIEPLAEVLEEIARLRSMAEHRTISVRVDADAFVIDAETGDQLPARAHTIQPRNAEVPPERRRP